MLHNPTVCYTILEYNNPKKDRKDTSMSKLAINQAVPIWATVNI